MLPDNFDEDVDDCEDDPTEEEVAHRDWADADDARYEALRYFKN